LAVNARFAVSVASHLLAGSSPNIEGLPQLGELGLALLLSAIVGVEREVRQKSAGLRTYTLVGVGAAVFMLISKYGFSDVLVPGRIVVDPSRVAAQIVTGIGFIGAGLIFVRQDAVRGLTTAAAIWVTAAIGAAAGAGLPLLAVVATAAYLIIAIGFPQLSRKLPRSGTAISTLRIRYPDGRGLLRDVLQTATTRGFAVDEMSTDRAPGPSADGFGPVGDGHSAAAATTASVEVLLHVHGRGSVTQLAAELAELPGVHAVVADDVNVPDAE
jgi:putative Mg2+ transporter-C (MgtC) family protein